jgi:hypothetical protein
VLCRHIHGGKGVGNIIQYILVAQLNDSIMRLGVRYTSGAFLVLEVMDEFHTQARVQIIAQGVYRVKFPIQSENNADLGVKFHQLSVIASLHRRSDYLQHRIQQQPGTRMLNRMG